MTQPMETDVVIIGGGAIGASTAFHLAEAGVRVVLVEQDEIGSGSTSRSAGGVRAQFSNAVNIALEARSLEAFEHFGDRPGGNIDLKQHGYLFVLDNADDLTTFAGSVELQNSMGVPSRIVDVAEIRKLCPLINDAGLVGGAFSPTDGHCTPEAVAQGYAAGARDRGAVIVRKCAVIGIDQARGAVSAVVTDRGTIETSAVVCAAGAWSAAIGQMAGVNLPVSPVRRQVLVTEPMPDRPADLPMTIDYSRSFYFHAEGPGLLIGMSDPAEEPGFNFTPTDRWTELVADAMQVRAPVLSSLGITSRWAGLYEVTPDHNAVLGSSAEVPGFFYATGFSGHGFLQSPAVGEVLRDLYLGRKPFIDVRSFSADRFAAAATPGERNLI
jgi:sarcosine oxidase subunit beta